MGFKVEELSNQLDYNFCGELGWKDDKNNSLKCLILLKLFAVSDQYSPIYLSLLFMQMTSIFVYLS